MKTVLWREGLELDEIHPNDDFLLAIQWTDKLADGESIIAATASADDGLTADVHSFTMDTVFLRLHTGTDGAYPEVNFSIDTDRPQHFERSFVQPVRVV